MRLLACLRHRAFTLVELLVSMAILMILLGIMVTITNQTSRTWRYASSKIEQFRDARTAFETITRRLSQATLNTYWDYVYNTANPPAPIAYTRQSDLNFVCGSLENAAGSGKALLSGVMFPPGPSGITPIHPGHGVFFQAPLGYVAPANATDPSYTSLRGLDNLLNTWGYYVEVNDDQGAGSRPSIFPDIMSPPLRVRSRLMELMQPANDANKPSIYQWTLPWLSTSAPNASPIPFTWFTDLMSGSSSPRYYHVLAENVIALFILPKLSKEDQAAIPSGAVNPDSALAPNYYYNSETSGQSAVAPILNSKNQLPPILQVTMVAIDEPSAQMAMPNAARATTFIETTLNLSTLFTDATKYASDLQANPPPPAVVNPNSLEALLIANKVNYRIFTTNVSIRSAKWSQAQVK
jgi:uncharacterized protein (TIGR02599 family)